MSIVPFNSTQACCPVPFEAGSWTGTRSSLKDLMLQTLGSPNARTLPDTGLAEFSSTRSIALLGEQQLQEATASDTSAEVSSRSLVKTICLIWDCVRSAYVRTSIYWQVTAWKNAYQRATLDIAKTKTAPATERMSLARGYGTWGVETFHMIRRAVSKAGIQMSDFDPTTQTFCMTGSESLSKTQLLHIIYDGTEYTGWWPKIEKKDSTGNWLVSLSGALPDFLMPEEYGKRLVNGQELPDFPVVKPHGIPVFQGGAKICRETGSLYTFGLGSCFAVVFYDQKNKVSALAHIDNETKVSGLHGVLNSMRDMGAELNHITVDIVGGDTSNLGTYKKIKDLAAEYHLSTRQTHIGDQAGRPHAITISVEDGVVTGYSGSCEGILSPQERAELEVAMSRTLMSDRLFVQIPNGGCI